MYNGKSRWRRMEVSKKDCIQHIFWYFPLYKTYRIVKNFKDFVATVFVDEMNQLDSKLALLIESNQTSVDMHDLLFRFTLDGFGKIGFGTDLGCMTSEQVPFAVAFDRCQARMDFRFFNPLWRIHEFIFYKTRVQHSQDIELIRSFGKDIIHKRRMEIDALERADLLSFFMKMQGPLLKDTDLCDYVLNFIIAGRDTTAQALSWCLYELSRHPHVEEKLLSEIHEFLGCDSPSYEQIKSMKYAKAVFQEALRLHPSVPKNIKQALRDEILPDGTQVPKGAMAVWIPYCNNFVSYPTQMCHIGMGRSEKIWGRDASIFNPDRWFDGSTKTAFEYPVFHAGPRICLGKNLAELEGVFVLVSLVKKYKISVVADYPITYANSLTLPMRHGLLCNVEYR